MPKWPASGYESAYMTGLELLLLAAFTMVALAMAALTPEHYRPPVYLTLLAIWVIVVVYLMLPRGTLRQPLHHWDWSSWNG